MKTYILTLQDTPSADVDVLIQRKLWIGHKRITRRIVAWCDVDRIIAKFLKAFPGLRIIDKRK